MLGDRDLDQWPLPDGGQEGVIRVRLGPGGGADAADVDGPPELVLGRSRYFFEVVAVGGADDDHVDVVGDRARFPFSTVRPTIRR